MQWWDIGFRQKMTNRYIQGKAFTMPPEQAVASEPRVRANRTCQSPHKATTNLLPAGFPTPQQGAEGSHMVQPLVTDLSKETLVILFLSWINSV
jgi:hypothetical protein